MHGPNLSNYYLPSPDPSLGSLTISPGNKTDNNASAMENASELLLPSPKMRKNSVKSKNLYMQNGPAANFNGFTVSIRSPPRQRWNYSSYRPPATRRFFLNYYSLFQEPKLSKR